MDSDEEDGFAKQGGDALDIGEDFDSEEEQDQLSDEEEDDMPVRVPQKMALQPASQQKKPVPAPAANVKG